LPGGPRLIAGFLDDRWLERASVARFWKTTPLALGTVPEIEYKRMREYAIRAMDEQAKQVEAARRGAPTPGRKGPKPGDTIVERKRGQPDIDDPL